MYITNKGGGIIIFTHTAQKKEFFCQGFLQ